MPDAADWQCHYSSLNASLCSAPTTMGMAPAALVLLAAGADRTSRGDSVALRAFSIRR